MQIITHLKCAVYVFVPFFNRTRILFGINACLIRITEGSKTQTSYPFSIIAIVFVLWTFFNLIKPIVDRDLLNFLLFLERFILGLSEIQMCFLLYYLKAAFFDLRENISKNTSESEIHFIQTIKSIRGKGSLESYRKEHLILYKSVNNLNYAYGLANFMFTMRERFSFAFYLYCWISKGRMFDVVVACVNFIEVFLLFYSFQTLKNQV